MKTFKQYIQEHNPLSVKSMVKKINPLDKQMAKLKSFRKRGVTGAVKDALWKSITGKRAKQNDRAKKAEDDLKKEKKGRTADNKKAEKKDERIADLEDILYGRA